MSFSLEKLLFFFILSLYNPFKKILGYSLFKGILVGILTVTLSPHFPVIILLFPVIQKESAFCSRLVLKGKTVVTPGTG